MSFKPLAGLRIVDLTRHLPGPLCTLLLSDLGAEVVKVEEPGGEPTRFVPPALAGASALFHVLNRGKRFVTLDLRQPDDRDRLHRLLDRADALVEGFRPDVLPRLGLDPADLVARHPGLVVARLSGWGTSGPYAGRPGHDLNYLAATGALGEWASPDPPPVQVADAAGAMMCLASLLAALLGRQRGVTAGAVLDVPILDGAMLVALPAQARHAGGDAPLAGGGWLEGGAPTYRVYRDRDGRPVTVAALEPRFAEALERMLGGTGADTLAASLGALDADGIRAAGDALPCVEPALAWSEVPDHPAVAARGLFRWMEADGVRTRLPVTPFAAPEDYFEGPWAGVPGRDNDTVLD